MSQTYVSSIAVLIVGILQILGIVVDQQVILGLITGILGVYIAYRRYKNGDINIAGFKAVKG